MDELEDRKHELHCDKETEIKQQVDVEPNASKDKWQPPDSALTKQQRQLWEGSDCCCWLFFLRSDRLADGDLDISRSDGKSTFSPTAAAAAAAAGMIK